MCEPRGAGPTVTSQQANSSLTDNAKLRPGSTLGGATLVAVAPIVKDRLVGWTEAEIDFGYLPVFDELSDSVVRQLRESQDAAMLGDLEVPSPRYSFRQLNVADGRLTVEAGCTDWSFVTAAQGTLFAGERPHHRRKIERRWKASTASIIRQGSPCGFSHHLGVHALVVTSDGYAVAGVRKNVSNQRGRVSLSFEEQMDVAHVSSRPWKMHGELVRINGDDSPVSAIRRGLHEELGLTGDPAIQILAVAVEDASIAVNFLGLVEVKETIEEVHRVWSSAVDRSESDPLQPQRSLVLDPDGLFLSEPLRSEHAAGRLEWHSSALLRSVLAIAARHGVSSAHRWWRDQSSTRPAVSFCERGGSGSTTRSIVTSVRD